MRYVILGAGAIGATIGGRLAEGGCQVTLVGRGPHAEAVKRNGLVLVTPDGVSRLSIPMVTVPELRLAAGDVLMLAVKSQDTAQLLTSWPVSRPRTASASATCPCSARRTG